jgi:glycosyltransferase involved in cell wall biosynthesis
LKFLIVTHAPHSKHQNSWYAYAPYVKEMQLWEKYVDTITIVAPVDRKAPSAISLAYCHKEIHVTEVSALSLLGLKEVLRTIVVLPKTIHRLFIEMRKADHIHLRCPGNIGLLGCLVQIFFPKKKKTAKYAGNWDPKAKQPWSYHLQKWLLSNTFLTKNMQVLVYGNWPHPSKNVVSFFTASYSEAKIQSVEKIFTAPYKVLFVGALTKGKHPLYAVQLIHRLQQQGVAISLAIYGEGEQREVLKKYVAEHNLQTTVILHGNQAAEVVEQAYKESHFLVLPSQSEGWPKVVAEAMFFGCIPMATAVSCVPEMLGHGKHGIFLTMNFVEDVVAFKNLLKKETKMREMSLAAQQSAQRYTLEFFELEIKKILG